MKEFEKCYHNNIDPDFCVYHKCGPTDPEQCGKSECPHCTVKEDKLQLTNSYLKAKDFGEAE